jgi:hypothetical protein
MILEEKKTIIERTVREAEKSTSFIMTKRRRIIHM